MRYTIIIDLYEDMSRDEVGKVLDVIAKAVGEQVSDAGLWMDEYKDWPERVKQRDSHVNEVRTGS